MDRGGQTYYYHQNALWSVEAITNSTAAVVERYSYDAYGLPSIFNGSGVPIPPNPWRTAHSAIDNPWMFTGRQFDEETGLYYYRARYYDPVKDRFLQRDPAGYMNGINLYHYTQDNPINILDPSGEDVTKEYSRPIDRSVPEDKVSRISITLVVDTSECPPENTDQDKCNKSVHVKLIYKSTVTIPKEEKAKQFAQTGGNFGLQYKDKFEKFKTSGRENTAEIPLGDIPCKGGELKNTPPDLDPQLAKLAVRDKKDGKVEQRLDFQVKIKCCGRKEKESLTGANLVGGHNTTLGESDKAYPFRDVTAGEKEYPLQPGDP
jgi:RHS repeat-associated protein